MRKEISRRAFVGMGAAAAVATATGCSPDTADEAVKPDASQGEEGGTWAVQNMEAPSGAKPGEMSDEEALAFIMDESEVASDLVLDDGTVVPAVYVRLRNRINRIGGGLGSNVDASHDYWQFVTYNFSEEEAEAYMKMPIVKSFTAAEYAEESGQDESVCADFCESLSHRGIIYRFRKGGETYYRVIPQINGIWEFSIAEWEDEHNDGVYNVEWLNRHWSQYDMPGFGMGIGDSDRPPMFRSLPASRDVMGEGVVLSEEDDFEALLRSKDIIAVGNCVCRSANRAYGETCDHEELKETEILTGDMARYYIELGIAREVTAEEAIEKYRRGIELGCVIQTTFSKESEIFCCCGSDCCKMLNSAKSLGGLEALNYYSRYDLRWNSETCIGCGTCLLKCPLETVAMEDGLPVTGMSCVRCGQCAVSCPTGSRKLFPTEMEQPEMPVDMFENDLEKAKTRAKRGYVCDYVPE